VDDRFGEADRLVLAVALIARTAHPWAQAAHGESAGGIEGVEGAPGIGKVRVRYEQGIGSGDELRSVRVVVVAHIVQVHRHDGAGIVDSGSSSSR
jgi:hypothetical protein